MKIKQLIEYEFPEIRQRSVPRVPNAYKPSEGKPAVLRNKKVKHMGSGAFASVYKNQDRPEDVTKISKPMSIHDGYNKYIAALKNHPDNGNPYFPKVRSATKYSDKETHGHSMVSRTVHAVKTESLRHLSELSTREVHSVLERWFGEDWENVLKRIYETEHTIEFQTWDKPNYVLVDLMDHIRDYASVALKTKDHDLLRALAFLTKLSDDGAGGIDFGMNNIMYKRSPYGIQLVFTDPIA